MSCLRDGVSLKELWLAAELLCRDGNSSPASEYARG